MIRGNLALKDRDFPGKGCRSYLTDVLRAAFAFAGQWLIDTHEFI